MFDLLFASIPFVIAFGGIGSVFLHTYRLLPSLTPEVVLVRSPYGYPTEQLETEKRIFEEETKKIHSDTHHLQFPIQTQKDVERAMTEIANRLHWFWKYFETPWFMIHVPSVSHVSYIETMLCTHGCNVSIMDIPIPTKDGFPTTKYYEWAESCPFVKHKEDLIQSYHTSW